ncbi:MAG: aminotransferase class I/II-fold pyridoxal phosphate-dependent enzyme [Chloroflexi bacterium]|nr:aminotransferase class I/II-fold pyridoxal phosphate-dependent enzyme [Chloroflexota bacterium]
MRYAAKRLDRVPPYPFAIIGQKVRELKAAGHDVIRLDMGSPDLPPPQPVIDKLSESANTSSHHGYAGFVGLPALRKAFADYYKRRFDVDLDPDAEVLPLIGSKEGIVNMALAQVDAGDVVLCPSPGYPAYKMGTIYAGGEPYFMPLKAENGFLPDLDAIPADVLDKARMIWVNYPNNPTGAVATLEDYQRILDFCTEHDILICSDNPYADVAWEGERPPSMLELTNARDRVVEFTSLSKLYNMAGWRVGACVGNPDMVGALRVVKSNIDSGLFRGIQDASICALDETSEAWVADRNEVYRRRRDILIEAMPRIGLSAEPTKASLYVWAAVNGGDDAGYAAEALQNAHVSIAPGAAFGEAGQGFVRISMIVPEERMKEAVDRLADWHAKR